MSGQLSQIWRHPIKSHGREALERITVTAGATLPWDRCWAVAHEAAKTDGSEWAPCANFSRGSKAPGLMAINAQLDEASETVTLTHPNLDALSFRPDAAEDQARFLDWVAPIMPEDRAQSARIVRVPGRGMTDSAYPSISLCGEASLRALSGKFSAPLDARRFRINLWVDGLGPWEEFEWIGREITVGASRFRVEERVVRCMATTANPNTGVRDADILGTLEEGWGHRDLGVHLVAMEGGDIAVGDPVALI